MGRKRRDFAVCDCETDPFVFGRIPKPFIWGFYDGQNYLEFEKTDNFIDYVQSRPLILYAHNGGKFDWHFIIDQIPNKTEILIINGRIARFKIGLCEFRDSYNILPIPLGDFQKDKIDYALFEENVRSKHMDEIKAYLKSDCKYLFDLINAFRKSYSLNITLASACMRKWGEISKAKPETSTKGHFNKFSPWYFGGRVQVFKSGIIEKPFKLYDINSAYPYAMTFSHPSGKLDKIDDCEPKINPELAFYIVDSPASGFFPVRSKTGLKFPNDGEIKTFYVTGYEYVTAKRLKIPMKIKRVYTFKNKINFTPYVNHFFHLKAKAKAENNKAEYLFSKLFMNSLYGKYGSNPQNYKEHILAEEWEKIDTFEPYSFLGGKMLFSRPTPDDKQRFYNVVVAASITGFVRAYLFEQILKSKNVWYCDTDSIICEGGKFPTGEKLGEWTCEGKGTTGAIAGRKLYAIKLENKWKIASKGVKFTKNDIFKIARGGEITYHNPAPTFSVKNGVNFVSRKIRKTVDNDGENGTLRHLNQNEVIKHGKRLKTNRSTNPSIKNGTRKRIRN